MTATLTIAQQLAALPRLSVKQLQARYAEVFGEATTARNKTWLVRRIAWKLQANVEGGLSERALARARDLAAGAELRMCRPAPVAPVPTTRTVAPAATPADRRLPPPGSTLTRVYKGARLQVRVLASGFEYAGVVYPSLSAVAKAITGSHCNGFLFFGLTKGAA
ncbi:MAG: DUF2924 domain-containing protein [Gemmataceae bacterium]|nr:DUF2924 domain-containing protein [Gemmataceae bacterium]